MTTETATRIVPAIEAVGVSRAFGSHQALHPVNLSIGPGEHVAIMGPSACGKTTLLNILGAIDRPDAGEVRVNGAPIIYRDRELTLLHRIAIGFVGTRTTDDGLDRDRR